MNFMKMTASNGCNFEISNTSASIYSDDSLLAGIKADATVCFYLGARSLVLGQFGVHILPAEGRKIAAMLIAAADAADESEVMLAAALAEAG